MILQLALVLVLSAPLDKTVKCHYEKMPDWARTQAVMEIRQCLKTKCKILIWSKPVRTELNKVCYPNTEL